MNFKPLIGIALCLTIFISHWANAQVNLVNISGTIRDRNEKLALPFVNVILKNSGDSSFLKGSITNEEGRFTLSGIKTGEYLLEVTYIGMKPVLQNIFVGKMSAFLELPAIFMDEAQTTLSDAVVEGRREEVSGKMDKKTYSTGAFISQSGGSVMQVLQNLPGVTVQEGKVNLRGSNQVSVLVDGTQSAMTGVGSQSGLENIPASSIESIEIINNPSAKFDANGNAGIINIIFKKEKKEGFFGKAGLSGGLGNLWARKDNLPGIRPQYQRTPKVNPSFTLNYGKNKLHIYVQGDYLYTETLNKNEFVTRSYDDGTVVRQQTKRNRNTHFLTGKTAADYKFNEKNILTLSFLAGSEKIIDRGDQPFYNKDLSERIRLWTFLEDELKTTYMGTASFLHKFKQPGHTFNAGANYTFHREDEKYFFNNAAGGLEGEDAFALISDETVLDFTGDYIRPFKYGRMEGGYKFRYRQIPTDMNFIPGPNSVIDSNAGGWAVYEEWIPSVYGIMVFETKKLETELGLRMEFVDLNYRVNPVHPTYRSDGYQYVQPFPNVRFAYKINDHNKLALFYNRRVDRPNEVDIRIFPKYDDAEIIKVGNPALSPQYTHVFELGWKESWDQGSFYSAAYHRLSDATITRIASQDTANHLIYAIFQNAGRSYITGLEIVFGQKIGKGVNLNVNLNGYHHKMEKFTVENQYPVWNSMTFPMQELFSGNGKLNLGIQIVKNLELQTTTIFQAPDIIPQGRMSPRFSMDLGLKATIQNGKGEWFINGTDIFNTLVIEKEITGTGFYYRSSDYYETQVIRVGYSFKF